MNNEFLIIDCKVVRAFTGPTKYDKEDANRITVYSDNMPYTSIWAFDECGSRYTPSWLKNADGYMNLKSSFDIPIKATNGKQITFSEWIDSDTSTGALIRVKIKQKEGAVYPVAVKILIDGEDADPFDDM